MRHPCVDGRWLAAGEVSAPRLLSLHEWWCRGLQVYDADWILFQTTWQVAIFVSTRLLLYSRVVRVRRTSFTGFPHVVFHSGL